MNATERRSIERIIKGRFELLGSELNDLAAEYRAQVQDDLQRQFAKELSAAEDANTKLKTEAAKLSEKMSSLIEGLKSKGIQPANRYYRHATKQYVTVEEIEWEPIGMTEARQKAMSEIDKKLNLAKNNLRREELNLLEKLHQTTIESGDAQEFLGEMPTAEDLMVKAAETRSLKAG